MQWLGTNQVDLAYTLDEPLVHYRRPDYLAANNPWIERITARDVLRHSTGLPNWHHRSTGHQISGWA